MTPEGLPRGLRFRKAIVEWLFNRRIVAVALRRDHVLCLGDSHVSRMLRVRVPRVWFRVRGVGGATASGVMNPNSQTNAHAIFSARLARAKPWQQVLLLLGEVDCGYLIWHRADRLGLTIDEQLSKTLDAYTKFIAMISSMGFRRVIVLSAPLPTISDLPSELKKTVASLRKEVTATQTERTDLTLRFNNELRERCDALGAAFIDVTTPLLDPGTGLVAARFLSRDEGDHHLEVRPYAELISSELRQLWP